MQTIYNHRDHTIAPRSFKHNTVLAVGKITKEKAVLLNNSESTTEWPPPDKYHINPLRKIKHFVDKKKISVPSFFAWYKGI